MKKSECFKKAQIAVVNTLTLTGEEKLEIVKTLIREEELALFVEHEQQEKGELSNVCSR